MSKRKLGSGKLEIPMSSMIDVVFLLLIYFIVTQKDEISEAHLAVNLPTPNKAPQEEQEKPRLLEIQVHPDRYYLNDQERTLEEMLPTLERFAEADPDTTVIVKVRGTARTEELVRVLDLCRGLGLDKLNLLTLR